MICRICGKTIEDDARFCPHCGTKTIDEAAAELAEKAVEEADSAAEGLKEAAVIEAAALAQAAETDAAAKAAEAEAAAGQAVEEVKDAADNAAEEVVKAAEKEVKDAALSAAAVPAEPPVKKKSRLPLILAIILVIAAAGGYLVYSNLPATKAGKLIKQAEAYLSEGKFEEALKATADAKALTPDNAAVFSTYDKIFEKQCAEYLDEKGEVINIKAANVYIDAASIVPEYKDKYLAKASEYVKYIAEVLLRSNDPDALRKSAVYVKARAEQDGVPGLAASITALETKAEKLEIAALLKDFGNKLKPYADAKDYDSMVTLTIINFLSTSTLSQKVLQPAGTLSSNYPIISEIDGTDKKIGIYYRNGKHHLYYGDYDANGKRSGEGIWIPMVTASSLSTTYEYHYVGTWENDYPNGPVTAYIYTKSSSSENKYTIETTAKNGKYDGEAKFTFSDGNIYTVNYVDGMPQEIKTDEKGRVIYGYNQDKSRILINLSGPDGVYLAR